MINDLEMVEPTNVVQFETQKAVMAGTWDHWSEERKREQIRILVREAYKLKFERSVDTYGDPD